MQNNWVSIIPAFIVLFSVIFTQKIVFSIGIGIISSALISTNFSILETIILLTERFWEQISDNILPILFTITMGLIITLISKTGGGEALAKLLSKKIKNKHQAEISSLIFTFFLFIDDYLNSLTSGCAVRSLTDKFKIPRVKLAFIIDSMASALCIISPVSTWIIFLIIQLKQAGISTKSGSLILVDPFKIYLKSIIFIFYAFLIIITSWFIVLKKVSYGPMKKHEDIATGTGNLYGGKTPIQSTSCASDKESIFDFFIPIVSLITLFTGISFFSTIPMSTALFIAGIFSFNISLITAIIRKTISANQLPNLIKEGTKLMIPSLQIIILAWMFSSLLQKDLQTGEYLASILLKSINIHLLPLMFFITSSLIALAMGSSWGTISIMTPIAIPAICLIYNLEGTNNINNLQPLFPVIGAFLSGSIAGAHLSPISDTVTISSIASGSRQLDHIKTQIPYVIPAIIGSFLAYLLLAIYSNIVLIPLLSGIFASIISIYFFKKLWSFIDLSHS